MDELQLRIFRAAMKHTDDVVYVADRAGLLHYANDVVAGHVNVSQEMLAGKNLRELFPESTANSQVKGIEEALDSNREVTVEREVIIKGESHWFKAVYFPLGESNGVPVVGCVSKDVTDRHNDTVHSLGESLKKTSLMSALPDLVFLVNRDGIFLDFHAPPNSNLMISRSDIVGTRLRDLPLPLHIGDEVCEILEKTFQSGELQKYTYTVELHKSKHYFEARMQLFNTDSALLVVRNITDWTEANNALRESEELNRGIIESAPVGIMIVDRTGKVTFSNPFLSRMMGVPDEEVASVINRDYREIPSFMKSEMALVISRLFKREEIRNYEMTHVSMYGVRRELEMHGTCLTDASGEINGVVLVMLDKTELHNLERQFHQAQKMEAIGRLAGGVAHDFNNLLTAILGHSDLAIWMLGEEHPASTEINEIQSVVKRASLLTQQLLAFGRKQMVQPEVVNLNDVIAGMDQIFNRTVSEDILIDKELDDALGDVYADRSQLGQVLLNLVINARDAIAAEGTIRVKTENLDIDVDLPLTHTTLPPGEYVMLSVEDTGSGIPEEIVNKIFEPFFTTKESGKGTGLGLATVLGIVRQLKGDISVESSPEKGTTFRVYLPRTEEKAKAVSMEQNSLSDFRGTERILMVEDDPLILESISRFLRSSGYHVHTASDGESALRVLDDPSLLFDLLLTDVVLPGIKGPDLAEQIKRKRPSMDVLFVSGYTENVVFKDGVTPPSIAYLPKPYTPTQLGRRIREILDHAS